VVLFRAYSPAFTTDIGTPRKYLAAALLDDEVPCVYVRICRPLACKYGSANLAIAFPTQLLLTYMRDAHGGFSLL
jgi:hypothetical protein